MDAKDAEVGIAGSVAIGRELGARRKFWALLLLHTLLTGACIACCVWTLSALRSSPFSKGIYLNMKKVPDEENTKLHFTVTWNQSMELYHESEVMVKYPGPYIFYICAKVTGNSDKMGNLTLEQGKTLASITLRVENNNARSYVRHEGLVSLYEDAVVTINFFKPAGTSNSYLQLDDLRVGLQYMLGKQIFNTPRDEE
ncbi:uncharacterized protein LOC108414557 isoform X2 [Pygocentrus nattereri]|uniref:uncharacterized protein LOC108414557 isoform X2 n=1 Tax=Pygocentrus nattereri TaxID=42514 RepID=UPI001891B755|nr:uncharacterized protein LOC108414557 isoform X2 [Pygocentrus nattereri]